MKKIFSIILVLTVISTSFSQQNEDDINSLSIFNEYSKAKNYEAAYGPWMELRNRNPKFHLGIYSEGEKILKYKIKNSIGEEKIDFVRDLILIPISLKKAFRGLGVMIILPIVMEALIIFSAWYFLSLS